MLLVHAVGDGDLGFACPGAIPDLEGNPHGVGNHRRPLRKVFDAMATGLQISRIALLGTSNSREGHGTTFADWATEIKERLASDNGLFGARFLPSAISVVEVTSPTIHDASTALSRWLDRNRVGEVLVTCGSGAFAMSAGAVCGALESHHPVRIVHIDTPTASYTLNQPIDPDQHLKSWLLRHRFWDALAEMDPANASLWHVLAARHAADSDRMKRLTSNQMRWSGAAKPWPIVQAALSERIGRGEAADYGLVRAWYGEQLYRLFQTDQHKLSPDTGNEVQRLIDALQTRADGDGGLSAHLRQTARALNDDLDSASVRMIRDSALTDLYTDAATHLAHLTPKRLTPGPLPPTLLAAIERWENGDPAVRLIAHAGETAWPVVGSGDVLALVGVGLDRPGVESEDQRTAETILAELWKRREKLLRRGVLRMRLLASPESLERARRIARDVTAAYAEVDVRVVENVHGGLNQVRETVVNALGAEAQPTGRTGSGSLRDVDEIVLFLNPGPPLTNYGMIAAGVAWSLIAACPVSMMELTRVGSSTQVRGGRPVLGRLGADRILARLTISAVERLDLRTARRLLERGSTRLHAALPAVQSLEANLYGSCPRVSTGPDQLALARQRLLLIAHVHGNHPGLAAYLAVTALRPTLFPWNVWAAVRRASPALNQLSQQANQSAHGHALDRQRQQGHRRDNSKPRPGSHDLLLQAVRELRGSPETDTGLIMQYKAVINSLQSIFREAS
ncbi:hypothetical protein [Nonomuraea angiospora]|uniref:hypothetical protein n=1 Tax=Nonomuraea angiospora TaxID=46172 RepID=UPI0029AB2110|nr:hypothetical protein [Nonomuraea angiospora]MDX3099975.1 hypothetical protein [Nonomuraea angiospora]